MSNNPLWSLLLKVFSFLSIAFLLLGAVLVNAHYLGLPENKLAALIILGFGVFAVIISVLAANFSNINLSRELSEAKHLASQLSQGEIIDGDTVSQSDLMLSLKDISDYLSEKTLLADQIATGDLSSIMVIRSESDILGNSLQNMTKQLGDFVQTKEKEIVCNNQL